MEQPQLTNQVSEFQPVTSLRPTELDLGPHIGMMSIPCIKS